MFSDILNALWYFKSARETMETAAQGILTRDEMESRRLLAAQDLQNGLTQSQIAHKFGVSRTTASRWHRAMHRRGVDSLRKRRATGRPSRLTLEQQQGVVELFRNGARVAGFAEDRWTTARFASAIYMRYGIRYDPDHVGRIMHQLGLRPRHHSAELPAPEVIFAAPVVMPVPASAEQSAA
jgi:transposase